MIRRPGAMGALAWTWLTACGPSTSEPVEDVRVATYDGDGPVRLLPDVFVVAVVQHGERLLAAGTPSPGDGRDALTLWAVGPCGEDPVTLYEGEVGIAGDLLLACDDDGTVRRLDPMGANPPTVLLEGVSCHFAATPAGLLAHDPVQQAVLLRPSPHEDGVEAITVAEGVPDRSLDCDPDEPGCEVYRGGLPYPFEVDGSSLFVIDALARLSRVELPTLASTVIAEDVADFVVLPGVERLLTEDVEIARHGGQGDGRVRLVDLASGESQPLHAVGLPMKLHWPIAIGKATETLDDVDGRRGIGAFDLRTGARIDMPKTSSLSIHPPDPYEEHLVLAADGTTYHRWSDEAYGWIELGSFPTCSSARQRNGRLEVMVTDCESRASGELWLADFDGSGPVLVASDLSSDSLTLEDRVVWYPANTTDDPFHDLMVGELYGEGRWRLDTHAMLVADPVREPDLGGDVLYSVFDGERSGLWRSALP